MITLAANTFTNPGYTFAGWSDGTSTYGAGASYTLSSDGAAIVFTAQWTADTDAYSYAGGGGSGSAPASGSGANGTMITLAANTFINPGYTFAGWSDGTSTYGAGASYTLSSDGAAIVFTAQWTADTDAYSYAGGGGSGSAPASGSGANGTMITLAANTFTNPGYTFAGWSDGTSTYGAGASYTLSSDGAAIVFTAQWTADTDAYSYAGGGGSGSAPASGSGANGTMITLAANTFTNPGYTFAGWSDGTSTYGAGASYTLSSDGAAIVFTAQWTAVSKGNQAPLYINSTSGTYGTPITLTTTGGSGTGGVTYVVDSGGTAEGCSISSGQLRSTSAGTCVVTATKTGDTNYNATSSPRTTITFAKATPRAPTTTDIPTSASYGDSFTAVVSTNSNGKTSVVSSTPGVCTVSGSKVTFVGVGICTLTPSVAAATNYTAATGSPRSFTVAKASTTLSAAKATVQKGTHSWRVTFTATLTSQTTADESAGSRSPSP